MSVRVALGTLIIKERLGTSYEETVEQISENPYFQYFLGFESFKLEHPFDPSMLVYLRKRLSMDFVCKINEQINQKAFGQRKAQSDPSDDDNNQSNSGSSGKKNVTLPSKITPARPTRVKSFISLTKRVFSFRKTPLHLPLRRRWCTGAQRLHP